MTMRAYAELYLSSNARAVLGGVASQFRQLASAGGLVGSSMKAMAKDAAKAAVALWGAKKAADAVYRQVERAATLKAAKIDLQYELKAKGKSTEQLDAEMKGLSARAFQIQALTPYTEADIIKLMKAGVKGGASYKDLEASGGASMAAAILATVEEMDAAPTMKKLVSIGTPFNISAEKYLDLADQLKRFSSASVTEVEEVAEAMKFSAGMAASVGSNIREELGIIATLAQTGIRGTLAGTARRGFLRNIQDPTKQQKGWMEKLGWIDRQTGKNQFFDEAGVLKPGVEIAQMMRKSMEGLNPEERGYVLSKIFDARTASVALAYLKEGKGQLEDLFATADSKAPIMQLIEDQFQGWNKQLVTFQGTWESVWAESFQPAESAFARVLALGNAALMTMGGAVSQSKTLQYTLSGGSMASTGLLAAGGAYYGASALRHGWRALTAAGGFRKIFGAGGIMGGVMTGKILQGAAGITPVYVTNASEIGGGVAKTVANTATTAAVAGGAAGNAGWLAAAGAALFPLAATAVGVMTGNALYESSRGDQTDNKWSSFVTMASAQHWTQILGAKFWKNFAETDDEKKAWDLFLQEKHTETSEAWQTLFGPIADQFSKAVTEMHATPSRLIIEIDGKPFEMSMDGKTVKHQVRREVGAGVK